MKYLLYGLGVSNKSVKKYFDKFNIPYKIYYDDDSLYLNINKLLDDIDCIIKSPGIPNNTSLIVCAESKKIKIISDLELFYLLNKPKYNIFISGSNGKTTVTSLMGKLLEEIGFKVSGNIGIPLFDNYLSTYNIIECSSYMLEYINEFKPNIYVLLNIKKHHLDHHYSFKNYIKAKLKPLKKMKEDDVLIYFKDDVILDRVVQVYNVRKLSFSLFDKNAECYLNNSHLYLDDKEILDANNLKLLGQDNFCNVMASLLVLKELNVDILNKLDIILNFHPLPHRLEMFFVPNYPLTVFYNDSKSTNIYSLNSAISVICDKYKNKKVILIIGGREIKQDYKIDFYKYNNIFDIYFFGKAGLNYKKSNGFNSNDFPSLEKLLSFLRIRDFSSDEVVLFSPGAPSMDEFSSFEERGKYFKEYFIKDKSLLL